MAFFFQRYMQSDESIVFYPGSGIDLSPLLIPSCNGKIQDQTIRFVYCDIANHVQEFFYDFKETAGNAINLEEYKSLLSRYQQFTDSLGIRSITISNASEEQVGTESYLKISLTISYEDGEAAKPQLFFFPISAEHYLGSIHNNIFDEQIHTIIHITQTDQEKTNSSDFFAPTHFKGLLNSDSELKTVKYLITDNTDLFTENGWDSLQENFPGWGAAGNSMIHDRSAEILTRRSHRDESLPIVSSTRQEKMERIQKKLDELQFEW